ncbi:MAG: hypothetical protein FJ271_25820 [Planctomycetes bacterium]|nr:hypothetical protein [Planctomycetota bacterium]
MPDDLLYDLLARWSQSRAAGKALTPDVLCRDCPELLRPLREHIDILSTMTWLEKDNPAEQELRPLTLPEPPPPPPRGIAQTSELGDIAMPLEALQRALVDASLLSAAELRSTLRQRQGATPLTATAMVQELLRLNKLTAYQLRLVLEGRGSELILGKYLLQEPIGAGGMGQVYRARHRQMDRIVAVKVLPRSVVDSPQAVDRFQREMRALARLNHPNIVAAYDADAADGRHFLVMQCVAGKDLSSLVRGHGPLPCRQAMACVIQAARGLDYAHKQGIVHRDIKPGNLIMDVQGTVKVLDLGLARIRRDDHNPRSVSSQLTEHGMVMGTVDYMAPEQALDTHAADQRADIYSLGCTLHFLLTGKPPFQGQTLVARMIAHREQAIPSLRQRLDVPECLDVVFGRMMAKKPEDRYQTMADLLAELESCATGQVSGSAESHLVMHAGSWELVPAPLAETSSAGIDPTIVQPAAPQAAPIITLEPRKSARSLRARIMASKRLLVGLTGLAVVVGLAALGICFFPLASENDEPAPPPVQSKDKDEKQAVRLPSPPLPPVDRQSPLDNLTADKIPAAEKFAWQPKELVAVIGTHAFRHWGPCNTLVVHPNGKTVISAGQDKRLRRWDVATLAEQPAIDTERITTFSLAIANDGKTLAVGCGWYPAPAAYIWDLSGDGPRVKHTLPNYSRPVTVLALSGDGKLLAFSGAGEAAIEIYDLSGSQPKAARLLVDHSKPVTGLAFIGTGQQLLSTGADGAARLWDLTRGDDSEVVQQMKGPCHLAASRDGKRLALSDAGEAGDNKIHLWDVSGVKPRREFSIDADMAVMAMALSPEGDRLAAASKAHVLAWDLQSGAAAKVQQSAAQETTCLGFAGDGTILVTGHSSGCLRRWPMKNGRLQAEPEPPFHDQPLLVPAHGDLSTLSRSSVRDLWDLAGAAPKFVHVYRARSDHWWRWRFAWHGRSVASFVPRTDVVYLGDWKSALLEPSRDLKLPEQFVGAMLAGDGATLLTQYENGLFRLSAIEPQSLRTLAETTSAYRPAESYQLGLSYAGDVLVAASESGVQVWQRTAGELQPLPFPNVPKNLRELSVSRDGKRIFAHSQAMERAACWERSESGFVERPVGPKHFGQIIASCFSSDGERLFVAWDWAAVHGYDLATGLQFAAWQLPGQSLSLSMSNDARHLILGNSNGTVYVLRLAPPPVSSPAKKS